MKLLPETFTDAQFDWSAEFESLWYKQLAADRGAFNSVQISVVFKIHRTCFVKLCQLSSLV